MKNLLFLLCSLLVAAATILPPPAQATIPLTPQRTGHAATMLLSGKVLVTGGINENATLNSALLYDPASGSFTPTGNMTAHRSNHTSTLLPDGRVLIAGGENSVTLRTAEVYNPATGVFTKTTQNMHTPRTQHTATLLQSGLVLLVGGLTADLFDPANLTFTNVPSTPVNRRAHAALLLPDGTVVITGGYVGAAAVNITEIYNPVQQTFTQLANGMLIPRANHSMTRLLDGRLLIAGGFSGTSPHDEVESYNPTTKTFTLLQKMNYHRSNQRALLLADGRVVVIGGVTLESGFLAINEVYDPAANTWSDHSTLQEDRAGHTATALPVGNILVVGGVTGNVTLSSAEVIDPVTHNFSSVGNMNAGRNQHTATLLNNGKVLLAAGSSDTMTLRSAELFDPSTDLFTTVSQLSTARKSHTATLLPNGRVLITGGKSLTGDLESAEIFNTSLSLFTDTGSLHIGRALHTATLLDNGSTLVVGGVITGGDETPTGELYDSTSGIFTFTPGNLHVKRKRHRATLLLDGTVLFTGGNTLQNSQQGGDRTTETAELYNPTTRTFSQVQDMHAPRSEHEATLLLDGTVVVSGGTLASVPSDIYLPGTESFGTAGEMVQTRGRHVALRLKSSAWGSLVGKVLVIGGDITGGAIFGGAQQAIDSVELYDPATGVFSTFGNMLEARQNHTATELVDGRILIAGGVGRPFISGTAEVIAGPVPSPTPFPTATPSATPTPTPTVTPTPTATPTPTNTPTPTPSATPPEAKPLNISTRVGVGTGDNALIGGFIITGKGPKKVIIRALGPSLADGTQQIVGVLANPSLRLQSRDGLLLSNDDWRDSQEQEIIDSGVPPTDNLEAAIVATLDPVQTGVPGSGQYTALVTGQNNGTGIGLVEIYDLDPAGSGSVLANISSRGLVETQDNVMIGGFIMSQQPNEGTVLVRALGPSLAEAQIANPLGNPTLEMHDENGAIIASNNDWQDSNAEAIEATGLAPEDPKEAAILVNLPGGQYTAVVRGENGTTGVSLVEIFYLQ